MPNCDDPYLDMVVLDTHVDTILRWVDLNHDLSVNLGQGYMDLQSVRQGNLSGAFFACCVEPEHVASGRGPDRLDVLLNGIADFCHHHASEVGLAKSADDILQLRKQGRFAVLPCIEGAQGIGDDLARLARFRQQYVSYISLTHFNSNLWADSSTDVECHGGISSLGQEAIAEMNRLDIVVDVSHISDKAFWDTLSISSKPVIASHSSARSLVDHPRNLTDEMIRAVAQQGGLIGVTWWPEYLSEAFRLELEARAEQVRQNWAAHSSSGVQKKLTSSAIATLLSAIGDDDQEKYNVLMTAGVGFPSLDDVLNHIEHVVEIAGAEAVCIGTDHGAVDFRIVGVEDCSRLPALAAGLAARGYDVTDISGIMGGNVLRFLSGSA